MNEKKVEVVVKRKSKSKKKIRREDLEKAVGLGAQVGTLEEAGARDGGKVQHEIANGDANARGVELGGGGTRRHKHTVGKVLQREMGIGTNLDEGLQGRRRSHCLVALRRSLPLQWYNPTR